jgi:sugar phosphate isomerase/epimerase
MDRQKRVSTFAVKTRLILALGISVAMIRAAAAGIPDPVGLELESLSGQMRGNRIATLEKVHNFGFKYVELVGDYGQTPGELKTEMRAHGLIATSAHFPYTKFSGDPNLPQEAVALGLTYVGCPSLPQRDALDEEGVLRAAAMFNRAGEAMTAQGLKFFYHPHGYEFKPYKNGTLFDLLVEKTDPRYVHFQMDIYWIVHAGQDPVKLLRRYPDRWVSMHLKDMKKGAPTGLFNGNLVRGDCVPLGQGQIDIVKVIETAHQVGVRSFFIEDESASPEKEIPQSLQFLRAAKW